MTERLRVGTWNLERSGALHPTRIPAQLGALNRLNCDVWVLTETHDVLRPDGHRNAVASSAWQRAGERLVTITSRHRLTPVPTRNEMFTAAAIVHLPAGSRPVLVYGTVITYAHDTAPIGGGTSVPVWSRHRAAVAEQTSEWLDLRRRFPDHDLCIAGDFNMNLDGTRWYGVKDARETLLRGLEACEVRCLTTQDLRQSHPQIGRASVDHICFTQRAGMHVSLEAWGGTIEGTRLSDHNGMAVDILLGSN